MHPNLYRRIAGARGCLPEAAPVAAVPAASAARVQAEPRPDMAAPSPRRVPLPRQAARPGLVDGRRLSLP
jgi:hypothetical protein